MRKITLIAVTLWFWHASQAQDSTLPRIQSDTLYTTSGFKVVKGDKLKMGIGTMPDGSFKFIRRNANSMFSYYGSNQNVVNSANAMPRNVSGYEYKVARVEMRGNKKVGFVSYAVLATGIAKYEVDVENAIVSGEIVVPKEYRPTATSSAPASTQSLAEELKKLKDLFDQGVLTKEEYEAAKKKLLN